jgi:hypothetical protein
VINEEQLLTATSTMWVVMAFEGVLARNDEDVAAAPALHQGLLLYRALAPNCPIILCTNTVDKRAVDHWLRNNMLRAHVRLVMGNPGAPTVVANRMTQVNRLRASGTAVRLAIESDILTTGHLVASGVPVLQLITPAAAALVSGPRTPRTWKEMNGDAAAGG